MSAMSRFIKTTLLGGLVVILPVTIILFVFRWLYLKITGWIQPLTNMVLTKTQLAEYLADFIVIGLILIFCFLVGVIVKTSVGRFIHGKLESTVLKFAPGYSLVKETLNQFLGRSKSPFSRVALVRIFENQSLATAFVTDRHNDGSYTVFIPTGPNPTSGQIYHLQKKFVHLVDVSIEDTMRSIISCGAGSSKLIQALAQSQPAEND